MNDRVDGRVVVGLGLLFGIWIAALLAFPYWLVFEPGRRTATLLAIAGALAFGLGNVFLWGDWARPKHPEAPHPPPPERPHRRLLVVGLALWLVPVLLQVDLPIMPFDDEPEHAAAGVGVLRFVDAVGGPVGSGWLRSMLAWCVVLAGGLLLRRAWTHSTPWTRRRVWIGLAALLASTLVGAVAMAGVLGSADPTTSLVRYPPLSRVLGAAVYTLFGVDELTARAPSTVFTLAAAFYLYRTVALFRTERMATVATLVFLWMPCTFHYATAAMLDAGVVAFSCAAHFYFARSLHRSRPQDLVVASALVGVGYLYKQPVLVAGIVMAVVWLGATLRTRNDATRSVPKLRWLLAAAAAGLAPVLCWMVVEKSVGARGYWFAPRQLVDPAVGLGALDLLARNLGSVGVGLVGLGLVLLIVRRRDLLCGLTVASVVTWSVLYVGEEYITTRPVIRFLLPMFPALAIGVAELGELAARFVTLGQRPRGAAAMLAAALALPFAIVAPVEKTGYPYPDRFAYVFGVFPYPAAFQSLQDNHPLDGEHRWLAVRTPLAFYSYRLGLDRRWVLHGQGLPKTGDFLISGDQHESAVPSDSLADDDAWLAALSAAKVTTVLVPRAPTVNQRRWQETRLRAVLEASQRWRLAEELGDDPAFQLQIWARE